MRKNNASAVKLKKGFDWKGFGFVWCFISIPVIKMILFYFYVNFDSVLMAFQDINGNWSMDNFKWIFDDFVKEDSVMLEALRNTFLFFINSTFVIQFVTLFLSYFLFKRIAGYRTFRVVMHLPSIIGGVAFVAVYKSVLSPSGPVYQVMEMMLGDAPELYADSRYAIWAILFYSMWTGLGGVLYQGAMARIPTEVFESAILDGVTPLKEFGKIIIPLIWPTITTLLIINFTGLFSASGPILLFTQGQYKTMTIAYWIWDQVYTYGSYNVSSAMGLLYTCIGVPLCLLLRRLLNHLQEDVTY